MSHYIQCMYVHMYSYSASIYLHSGRSQCPHADNLIVATSEECEGVRGGGWVVRGGGWVVRGGGWVVRGEGWRRDETGGVHIAGMRE